MHWKVWQGRDGGLIWVRSRELLGKTEENYEESQSGQPVS